MFDALSPELAPDLRRRLARIQPGIKSLDVDAIVLCTPVNLLYTSGKIFSGCAWIPHKGEPHFFVRRPQGLTGTNVHAIRNIEEVPAVLAKAGLAVGRWALEGEELTWSFWPRLSRLSEAPAVNGSGLLRRARSIKTAYEISLMRDAGLRHAKIIATYPRHFKPGMTDQQFALECEASMRRAGSLGLFRIHGNTMEIFMGSVLAGDNAAAASPYDFALGGAGLDDSMPVGQNNTKLLPGMTVLVDIAANFNGYLTDCSRTFSIGPASKEVKRAHQWAIDIQAAVVAAAKPGVSCESLYQLALDTAAQGGYADTFMGLGQKAKFIGHGTGLYINEWPVLGARSAAFLEPGNVIAIEPKIILPGVGAVGVEDTFAVTETGLENLTPCDPQIVELQ